MFHINKYFCWTHCWPPQICHPQAELLAILPHVFHLRKDKFSSFQALAVTRKGNVLLKCLPNCQIHKLQIIYYAKIWIAPIMQEDRVRFRLPDNVLVIWRRSEGKLLPSVIRSGEHCAVWCIYRMPPMGKLPPVVYSLPVSGLESKSPENQLRTASCCAVAKALTFGYVLVLQGLGPAPRINTGTLSIGQTLRICLTRCRLAFSHSLLTYHDVSLHQQQGFVAG